MERVFEFISKTGDGVCAVDRTQRIVLWNPAAQRLLGYGPEEVLGRHCYEILGGTDETGCVLCRKQCTTQQLARRGRVVPTRDMCVRNNAGRPTWISVSTVNFPSRWRELSVLAHLFRDVNRQKALEGDYDALASALAGLYPNLETDETATSPPADETPELTGREREVLRLLAIGASTGMIARRLFISRATVRNHVQSILAKFGVHSRLEAVTIAIRSSMT